MGKYVVWSMKDLTNMVDNRRRNRFDANLLITGNTGLGKSTFLYKMFLRFPNFKIQKHMVYGRKETIKLLENQKFSYCWNDELISVGNKRKFWDKEQIELIETITKYRANFNVFGGALPVFFSLDKELLKLFAINVDIIRRGLGVIHMRREGRRYTDDPWDTKYNSTLEQKWSKRIEKDPYFKVPYTKYSTFKGYIYFSALTPKQEAIYENLRDIKKTKLSAEMKPREETDLPFREKLYNLLLEKTLTKDGIFQMCKMNKDKYPQVISYLNARLRGDGMRETVSDMVWKGSDDNTNKNKNGIKDMIPKF